MLQVSKNKAKTTTKSSNGKKKKKYTYVSPEKRKFKYAAQKKVDAAAKRKVAKRRHDETMRSTGRKKIATDYPRKGEKKKK